MAFKFESLRIWHLSLDLADEVALLAQTFPKHEIYSLSSQIRRAANSVSLNIVEGSTVLIMPNFKDFLLLQIGLHWKLLVAYIWRKEEIISQMRNLMNSIIKLKF